MSDAWPSVALLSDDAELCAHLRQALQACGVRIVHECSVAAFTPALLRQFALDALVVNLDEDDGASLERLLGMLEGERLRLVFNDARASCALDGWDRARWARHLAMKVLASGDVDPPRPAGGVMIEMASPAPSLSGGSAATSASDTTSGMPFAAAGLPAFADYPAHGVDDAVAQVLAAADDLEAELAALLPSAAPSDGPIAHVAMTPEPQVPEAIEPFAHHDQAERQDLGSPWPLADLDAELAALLAKDDPLLPQADPGVMVAHREWALHDGDLGLASGGDGDRAAQVMAGAPAGPGKALAVSDSGALVGRDVIAQPNGGDRHVPNESGDDSLALQQVAMPAPHAAIGLELDALEGASAAQEQISSFERLLDDPSGGLSHVVVLGAAADGLDSVCAFLASLPASARPLILLAQHFGPHPVETVLARLANQSRLPVRLATQGSRARGGEVWLVPAAADVRLHRDGKVELREQSGNGGPSIDASFTLAAEAFGRDALGIVFAGRASGAMAGARAIRQCGGQIWAEAVPGEPCADMVGALLGERLVNYSGTPRELAAHLTEAYP